VTWNVCGVAGDVEDTEANDRLSAKLVSCGQVNAGEVLEGDRPGAGLFRRSSSYLQEAGGVVAQSVENRQRVVSA
jgi:hypothetical protein